MSSTYIGETGLVYYAKPGPAFSSTPAWSTDTIAGTEAGTTGVFSFATTDTVAYTIFRRIGGTPASTDEALALTPTQSPGILSTTNRGVGQTIEFKTGELVEITRSVVDINGDAVTLTGMTLELVIETQAGTDVAVISGGSLTLSGSSFTFTSTAAMTLTPRILHWSLRVVSTQEEIAAGLMPVVGSPLEDAA